MMIPIDELLTGVRWELLKALATHGELTASELAARAKTTLPSVSQAMKLLEAYGHVSVKRRKRQGPGKPTYAYELKKEVAHVIHCRPGQALKESFEPGGEEELLLNLLFFPAPKDRRWVMHFLCIHEELQEIAQAIAYVETKDKEVHLLVITEDVESYRKKYSNTTVKIGKESCKIVCWSHTQQEAIEGLQRNEKYFVDLFKKPHIIQDTENIIGRIREGGA